MLQTANPDIVLDCIERYRSTWMVGFPNQYAGLLEAQQAKPRDVSSLRLCLTGGDVCPVDLQNRVTSALGAPLHNVWGATEGAGQITFGLQPGPVLRIGEAAQVRIVDENGADVAHGEVGELLIGGANVFVGYWDDPAATARSRKDGWYYTGDLVRRGEGDELWLFRARRTSSFVAGPISRPPRWRKPWLPAIRPWRRRAWSASPIRCSASACSASSSSRPARGKAGLPRFFQNVAGRLASYKVPEGLRVIEALPRNALGKVDRRALERMVSEDKSAEFPA